MHAFSIEELTRDDIRKLTVILYSSDLRDPESIRRISSLIDSLPSSLHRSRILNVVPNGLAGIPAAAKTCALHKRLNGQVIRSILDLVKAEVSERHEKLTANQVMLSDEQKDVLHSLREMSSMWMSESEYRAKFLVWPREVWGYQHDGCEACMLSRVGRDETVITNLRTVLLSRTRTTKKPVRVPRLMTLADEFICLHGPRQLEIFVQSGEVAKGLKAARRELHAEFKRRKSASRKKRRKSSQKSSSKSSQNSTSETWSEANVNAQRHESTETIRPPAPMPGRRPESSDLVNEIIDMYADISLTQFLPEPIVPQPTHLQPQHWNNHQDEQQQPNTDPIVIQPLAPKRWKSHNAFAQEKAKQEANPDTYIDHLAHPAYQTPRRANSTSIVSSASYHPPRAGPAWQGGRLTSSTSNPTDLNSIPNYLPPRTGSAWKGGRMTASTSNPTDLASGVIRSPDRKYPPTRWYPSIYGNDNNIATGSVPRASSARHTRPRMDDDTKAAIAATTAYTLPRSHTTKTKTSNEWAQEYREAVRKDELTVPEPITMPTPSSVYSREWDDAATIRGGMSPGMVSTAETTWSFVYNGE